MSVSKLILLLSVLLPVFANEKKIRLFDPPGDDQRLDVEEGIEFTVKESDLTDNLCTDIYTTKNANLADSEFFEMTTKPIRDCTLYDSGGNKIANYSDLKDEEHYYAVPAKHHFVWPATKVGEKRTLPVTNGNGEEIILETLTTSPRLFRLHNFVSMEETDLMIENANTLGYERSTGGLAVPDGANKENQGVYTSRRTSENAWDLNSEIGSKLKARAYKALGIVHDTKTEDGFQVVRYKPGQFYMSHTDFFDIGEDKYWNFDPYNGGSNRFATVFLYLSDAEMGGETVFPSSNRPADPATQEEEDEVKRVADEVFPQNKMARNFVQECRANYRVVPKKGDAVVFYHQDRTGKLDPAAIHGACPVLKGYKWGANLWIWNDLIYDLSVVEANKPESEKDPRLKQLGVTFVNKFPEDVELYWLGGDDGQVYQGSIPSGDQLELNSYHGHQFVARRTADGPVLHKVEVHHKNRYMELDGTPFAQEEKASQKVTDGHEEL